MLTCSKCGKPAMVLTNSRCDECNGGWKKQATAVAQPKRGAMNKTEAAYASELEALRRAGVVQSYDFEAVTFKLAHDCRYTPDFMVVLASGLVEFHEVKGFWRDDARIKVRVAADKFPAFSFKAFSKQAKKAGGGWKVEQF